MRIPARVTKVVVFVVVLLPLVRLLVLGFANQLGANPVESVTRSTGTWTLVMLLVTLSVTPLRVLSGFSSLAALRRMLGLFAFFYAALHLLTFVWFEHWFNVAEMLTDVLKRPFVTAGMAAFLLMSALAATSTNAMIRRLGRRWQALHRLIYAIAALGVLHLWWAKAGKNDLAQPRIYALMVALLLAFRFFQYARRRRARSRLQSSGGKRRSNA
ncbi:MAG: sulfoxide reductase heme-binding subunit YedZ [Burkholderiaceae bacterium]|nr:sulfoxide reductase heme-binding subunit YedZ [Burkholderiaceae bacterium]